MKRAALLTMALMLPAVIDLASAHAGGAVPPPNARSFLPAKADLQSCGFSGWLAPWELKSIPDRNLQVQPFPSEEAYFAASRLAQIAAGKAQAVRQIEALPEADFNELKDNIRERLEAMEEEGLKLFTPFPAPLDQIQLDMIELARQNKLTKTAMVDIYKKRLQPLESAAEISFVLIKPGASGEKTSRSRGARIAIRICLYAPDYMKAHAAEFSYSAKDRDYFVQRLSDYYSSLADYLLKSKGQELEEEIEEIQSRSGNRSAEEEKKIRDLSDALDALDVLQKSEPAIDAVPIASGDGGMIVRAVTTFPEARRADLDKAGGDVSTMISASLRQGSAVVQVELIANDNSLYSNAAVDKLLTLMAQKLQTFRLD